ncbi:type II secretion system F family protein [Nocardioides sp. GY 10113]|uniref:type II secretion system F family protein n=1 Tax=Nocardioides sp. GY 10113 TaxID=2569761 RepID=UPI0010A79143|nr:type II secretion system F family protein [Nocardioides sp. GY 10113]TIC81304.1 type II secretion system F family protein [Nocardioides sp. GY 10113]
MSPALMLLLGGGLILAGTTLVLVLVGGIAAERAAVGRSLAAVRAIDAAPAELKAEVERPFAERVIAPLGGQVVGLGRRLVRADAAERLQHQLDVAGNPPGWDVTRIIGTKALAAVVLTILGLVWAAATGLPALQTMVLVAAAGAFGFVLPNILLYNAGTKREQRMQRALPDALDLMTVSVEAGLAFDAALDRVVRHTTGPLAQEFARLLQEMQIGVGRTEAMRAMAERTTLADLRSFSLAIVQADQLGVPIGRVLRVQSREMRTKRRQRAEEKAMKVPVKIVVPLVLFILPCLFLIIGGPAAIQVIKGFGGLGG